jgi:hypothetical protein
LVRIGSDWFGYFNRFYITFFSDVFRAIFFSDIFFSHKKLVGLRGDTFTVGQTTLKAASSKLTKHEKTYFENQYAFIPFTFDTLIF